MAKISARGAREVARYEKETATGGKETLVLASDGRVLHKFRADAGYVVLYRHRDQRFTDGYARHNGYEPVAARA